MLLCCPWQYCLDWFGARLIEKIIPAGRDLELSTRAQIISPKGESTPTRMKIFPQRGGMTPDSPNYLKIVESMYMYTQIIYVQII